MKLSQLPRSLAQVRVSVQKSGTGAALRLMGRRASAWQQGQGTRAFPGQGTMSSGNTPDPLNPGRTVTPDRPLGWDNQIETPTEAVFSTLTPVIDGTEGTIIQTDDWPPNPSREVRSGAAGRSEQMRTDATVQMGEMPNRIERQMPMRIYGVVGITTGQRGSEAGYDSTAGKDYLAHIPVPRRALGVKGPQKLSDDNAVIPAIYAGNPR